MGYRKAFAGFEFIKYGILALIPILSIYDGISFVNLGEILLLGIMLIEIVIKKGSFDINANLFIIIMFLAILNIVTGFLNMNIISFTGYWHNSIDMIMIAVICAYFVKSTVVKKEIFYQYVKVIALLSSFFLFIQWYFYSKGIVLYGFLPFLGTSQFAANNIISISYGRPNSFFMEPAHFAIYVLPVYAISLIKKQYVTSFILFLALFLSTSTTGIVTAIIVTVILAIKEEEIPIIIKWIVALAISIIILQFIPLINQNSIFKKINFVNLKENIRVFGTLSYFKYLNIKELLLGVGINEISAYMRIFANLNISNYSNSFFFSFLSFGVLGGTIWSSYIVSLYHLNKNKVLYIVFIFVYFSDQILFNSILVYLLLILYVFSDNEDDLKQKLD
jgi:hypothetical protein